MALSTKAALLGAVLAGTASVTMAFAQTATPTPTPATTPAATATPEATPAATPEATPAATPAPADAAAAPAAPAKGASPVAPAANRDAASVGGYYIDSTHGDWQLRCLKAAEGTDPCELYQLLKDGNGNPVSEVSLIPLTGQAVAGATMVAPLETDLPAGLTLQVDANKARSYPFAFCAQIGCIARIGFSQAELDQMKKGNKATLTLLPYGAEAAQKVDLNLSLKGFTAGFEAMAAKVPAAKP